MQDVLGSGVLFLLVTPLGYLVMILDSGSLSSLLLQHAEHHGDSLLCWSIAQT